MYDPERRLEHEPDYQREPLRRELLDSRDVLQPRVIDDDVSLDLEGVEHRIIGEVSLNRIPAESVGYRSRCVLVQIHNRDLGSGRSQPLGARAPDPARGPGYQGAATGE